MSLLKVDDIHVYYGAIHAIKGVSFEVNEGEIVTLIGANGAGKSTTLNTVAGLLRPRSGVVTFDSKNLATIPAAKTVSLG
ncbi:MAG: ATP-binding cassette domain-containing protein, partial [Clostridia bacterium]|nr:ATP-binding cassette domain-containing protein [Clostridia bacterium]